MSTIAQHIVNKNLSFSEMKAEFEESIAFIDGAELSHGKDHVDVIFNDNSNIIYDGDYPSKTKD